MTKELKKVSSVVEPINPVKLAFMLLKASNWPIVNTLRITKVLRNQSKTILPKPEAKLENVPLIIVI